MTYNDPGGTSGYILKAYWLHRHAASVNILGHKLSRFGLSTLFEKIKTSKDLAFPETLADAWTILGTLSYHRSFVKNYSNIAKPLTDALCL